MKKTLKPMSRIAAIIRYAACGAVGAGLIAGNLYAAKYKSLISVYLNQPTQEVVNSDDQNTEYFTSDFSNEEERKTHLEELGTLLEAEGIVLLENKDHALPLDKGAKISVLGQDCADPVYGGGGASTIDTSVAVSLKDALAKSGLEMNTTLWDFYENGAGKDYRKTQPDVYGEGAFTVNEVPVTLYTDEIKSSFADYGDAAVVVIGRTGSEVSDHSTEKMDTGYNYLQLDDDERSLLQMASEEFDKVIVLLNTSNPMELGVLEEYDVDSVLWIGALGQTGSYAVGQVLTGEVNPSGALVDTFAYDNTSAPSMENFGNYTISNSQVDRGNNYMVYGEGIYVGYRYYETRYEDVVLGNEAPENYNYSSTVKYPFGYGISYTDFEWSDFAMEEKDDTYEITVQVKNTGDTAGKDIVQIYMQSPYTEYDKENGIEKSSVELAGFEKTSLLAAGEAETVTVSIPKESMKTYDANGYGTYIVDAGNYYFAAGENAHDALNNILAAKGSTAANGMDYEGNAALTSLVTVAGLDSSTYAVSSETENEIKNQFEAADVRYYDSGYRYLSRSDWSGTWPSTYSNGAWEAPQELLDDLEITYREEENAKEPITSTIDEETGELSTAALRETEASNPAWDTLIQQMSIEELDSLVRIGGYATQKIDSIQLPATVDKDGTAGISSALVGGESGTAYPAEIVIASTWNSDLAEEFGRCIGEDSIDLGVTVWYAPACNIHRSAYSGRNFEYYSEDPFLSGVMTAKTVAGAQAKGVIVTVKHFALNDQECNRTGGAMFANEQSIREIYLKPFEISVREADALGMMASMNRLGARWSGGHYGLMTSTLREEWGFNGFVVTDQASFNVFAYEDLREGLLAGTDLWLNTDAELWKLSSEEMTPTVILNMQNAAKHIAYAVSRSNAMNGISAESKIVAVLPLWEKALIACDVLAGVIILAVVIQTTRRVLKKKDSIVIVENKEK